MVLIATALPIATISASWLAVAMSKVLLKWAWVGSRASCHFTKSSSSRIAAKWLREEEPRLASRN